MRRERGEESSFRCENTLCRGWQLSQLGCITGTGIFNCRPSSGYGTCIPNHHFKVWLQHFCQLPLFEPGAWCTRPQCALVLDIYLYDLLYCERGSHSIRRQDAQVRLLAGNLAIAARHPIVEERPLGRHTERPDIHALGGTGGTDLFDVTICHPTGQAPYQFTTFCSVTRRGISNRDFAATGTFSIRV